MATTVPETSTIRQPSVRHLTPLGELLEMHHDGTVECERLDALGLAHGNLDAHLDSLSEQIRQHPESAWSKLEVLEARRLGG